MPTEQREHHAEKFTTQLWPSGPCLSLAECTGSDCRTGFHRIQGYCPKGSPLRDFLKSGHFQAGIIVLMLFYRACCGDWPTGYPTSPAPQPAAMLLAHAAHWLLYGLMLALPILGIAIVQGNGKDVVFLVARCRYFLAGQGNRAQPERNSRSAGQPLAVAGHLPCCGAVWHHRFVKDDTLTRLTGPIRP
jgi:cytochrome b561